MWFIRALDRGNQEPPSHVRGMGAHTTYRQDGRNDCTDFFAFATEFA
jgi:hypothetical protein